MSSPQMVEKRKKKKSRPCCPRKSSPALEQTLQLDVCPTSPQQRADVAVCPWQHTEVATSSTSPPVHDVVTQILESNLQWDSTFDSVTLRGPVTPFGDVTLLPVDDMAMTLTGDMAVSPTSDMVVSWQAT